MLDKICEVFTKEYRKETKYRETELSMLYRFKLKDISENIEDKVSRLSDNNFVSGFKVTIGGY